MQNLKITIKLSSAICLDRYTTIDGILLSCYYAYLKKNGKVLPFDKEHKGVNFIYREKGVFSGSLWYIDSTQHVLLDFQTIIKNPEHRKVDKVTGKKTTNNPLVKQALLNYETMLTDSVYFYIKGDRELIENLLVSNLKFLGKKANLGYGKVSDVIVEEISEDKGFFLRDNVPSKPLDCEKFEAESNSTALFRNMPPYWLKEDLVPCYMPSSMLIEEFIQDEEPNKFTSVKNMQNVSNCSFLFSHKKKDIVYDDNKVDMTKLPKKLKAEHISDNKSKKCAFTGEILSEGISVDDTHACMRSLRKNFSDYSHVSRTGFISDIALWNLSNMSQIAYSLVGENQWDYLQGKDAVDGTRLKDYIVDTTKLKPPFSINLKDTQNSQHISFKGRVSISNGFFFVQYGNETLSIDGSSLEMAIKEIDKIISTHKDITKTHLCGNYRECYFPELKNGKERDYNQKIVDMFQKKYDSDTRKMLSIVAY